MNQELTLFRGTRGENIICAIDEGVVRPGQDHKVWFSKDRDDALKHGGDLERRETYAVRVVVTVIPGASVEYTSVHANPLTVVITSNMPLPIKILELYIRRPRGDRLETVTGSVAIKAHLVRARAAARAT
jgi:hypothetical protein